MKNTYRNFNGIDYHGTSSLMGRTINIVAKRRYFQKDLGNGLATYQESTIETCHGVYKHSNVIVVTTYQGIVKSVEALKDFITLVRM